MSKWLAGVAAIFIFIAFLLVSVPARFALQFVDLPPNAQIGGVDGSIWQGEIDALRVDDVLLRELTWQLRPWSLLAGNLVVQINIGDHIDNIVVGAGQLSLSRQQLLVESLQLEGRVSDFAAFAPQPSPFPMRGDIILSVQEYRWGRPVCEQVQGNLELVGGAIQVGQNWESLGQLSADLSCENGWLSAELTPNNLGLEASMRVSMHSAEGEFQINESPQAPRTIRNLVAMLPESARRPQRFSVRF